MATKNTEDIKYWLDNLGDIRTHISSYLSTLTIIQDRMSALARIDEWSDLDESDYYHLQNQYHSTIERLHKFTGPK